MRMEAPESGTLFVHVPLSENLYAVVVGLPASYRTHWIMPKKGGRPKPIRCVAGDGGTCVACGQGLKYNVRYMIPVRVGQPSQLYLQTGRAGDGPVVVEVEPVVRMLEFGRPQYGFVATREMLRDWVGTELQAHRKTATRNGEILVRKVGQQFVPDEDQVDAITAASIEGLLQYEAWVNSLQGDRFGLSRAPLGLDGG